MISFSNTNSEKNAVGRPQHQNVSLVFEEILKETFLWLEEAVFLIIYLFRRGSVHIE